MANSENIPSLAKLALQYGTITDDQYKHVTSLYKLRQKEKKKTDYAGLLLGQKLATRYQLGLLQLIREYHIIRRRGEEFGRIAVKKGFAAPEDIRRAMEIQKKEFKESRLKKLIGDILVETRVITAKQKNLILKEQTLFDKKSREILSEKPESGEKESPGEMLPDPDLSDYEKDFLMIKALDQEFSASVLEKGLASEGEIAEARQIQEEEFEQNQSIKILGDIMVSLEFITRDQKAIILAEQGRAEESREKSGDKITGIEVSRDEMTAWIHLDPKQISQISLDDIKSRLKSEGITHGIYPDAILQCHLDVELTQFPVARNDNSQAMRKARHLTSTLDTGLTDRGEKRKGDQLIQQDAKWSIPSQTNIYGKKIKTSPVHDFTLRCGSGTRLSKDKVGIVAAKTGVPAVSVERFVYIHPIIHVLEDADQRYGQPEAFANLTVSGTITGAYPITAGHIKAREIRGGNIEAVGEVRTDVGITDAVIRCQGDIHARYIHNCTIETFGNIYIKNEIFDSEIKCSGQLNSPTCRVITSTIHAKQGVVLAGTGSAKTAPCTVVAGTDHHILSLENQIREKIREITEGLRELKEKSREARDQSQKIFQKMVERKIFHDRAKEKKEKLGKEFNKKKEAYAKNKLKNILKLISNFEKRMEDSVASLKGLNKLKKGHDNEKAKLDDKIKSLSPKIEREILSLEQTLLAYLEWARFQEGKPKIEVHGKAFTGSRFGGIYSETQIESDLENFSAVETGTDSNGHKIEFLQLK